MTNSNLSAFLSLVRRKEVEELPDFNTTYLILGICSGVSLLMMLIWSIVICCRKRRLRDIEQGHELSTIEYMMEPSPEMYSILLPLLSIITSFNLTLGITMCYFIRRRRVPDEEAIELIETKPNLERGMLVEIISIYRDGIEIYTKPKSPASPRLYYHPSLKDPEQAHMHIHNVLIPPKRSIDDLRRELVAGIDWLYRSQ
ncbi:hypothetical protein FPHYL_5561 [Fusarium phyllophilum]|uniref:Uncharacterized protein n=1 Tax=Fusarium phyllophilum TaxID=47803 RepID=A0A8H5JXH7_9HYPO|nr:hypothetical protein FPHYL_5561 [Fusarium phyllophilum]